MDGMIKKEAAKVGKDVELSKNAFNDLKKAEIAAPGVGEEMQSVMRLLFQLKADTRHLKMYLNELNISSLQGQGEGDRSRALLTASAANHKEMTQFEKKFIYHDHLHDANTTTEMICELSKLKDNTLSKIINNLFGTLGIDLVVKNDVLTRNAGSTMQRQGIQLDTYASQGGNSLLHLFSTFKAVEVKFRRINTMSPEQSGLIKEVENLRSMIEQLSNALEASRKQSAEASTALETMQSSHGRHQMLVRSQVRCDALENERITLEKEVSSLSKDKFALTQQISSMTDNLVTNKAQLREAKVAYQRDVAHLFPLVADRITQQIETKKVLESMSSIADMGMTKAQVEVRRNKELMAELRKAEEGRTEKELELQNALLALDKMTVDRNRLQKINLVVTAAKMKFHSEALELQRSLAEVEGERNDLRVRCRDQDDSRELLDSLYERLDKLSESAEKSKDLYLVEKTANQAFVLQNQQLKAEVEGINSGGGMTDSKKREWAEREEHVERLKKSEERMKADLSSYVKRIHQLERRNKELEQELAALRKRADDYL